MQPLASDSNGLNHSLSAAPAFVLTWLLTAGACVLAAAVTPWLVVLPVVIAVGASFSSLPGTVAGRALGAVGIASAPLVVLDPVLAWPVAAVMAAIALVARRKTTNNGIMDLQRHLAWCRRRGEEAAVLVMRAPAGAASSPDEVRHSLRLTDSVHVVESVGGYSVVAILDNADLSVDGLEQRVRSYLKTDDIDFGWSTFPHDGVTLEVLERVAWRNLERPRPVARRALEALGATS